VRGRVRSPLRPDTRKERHVAWSTGWPINILIAAAMQTIAWRVPGVRASREAEETRERIIRAAMKVFAEYGYFKAPVRLIAMEAGVSKGLIFWYFRSKDEIIQEVALRALPHDVIKSCLDEGLIGCPLVDCIARRYLEKYRDETMMRLLVHTMDVKNAYESVDRMFRETCEKMLREVATRAFPQLQVRRAVTLARLLFGGLLCLTLSKPRDMTVEEYMKELEEIMKPYCAGGAERQKSENEWRGAR
jgi:AcrR family transcriptional regulator